MKKDKARLPAGPIRSSKSKHTTPLGPRHRRLLQALLRGPITREQADKIARASNAPEYIARLRAKGVPIQTRRQKKRDADGVTVHPGVYWLDRDAIPKARQLLEKAV